MMHIRKRGLNVLNKEQCKAAFQERLLALSGIGLEEATVQERYAALASLVRDYIG